jgi:hypothetical protein
MMNLPHGIHRVSNIGVIQTENCLRNYQSLFLQLNDALKEGHNTIRATEDLNVA